ncbi:MAG: hypothetical protein R2873_23475 [Caldilineaceae bacterium]
MQQFWNDVGVKVNVEHMDGPTFVTRFYEEHDFDLGYGCCEGVAVRVSAYSAATCSLPVTTALATATHRWTIW